jgi:hypothetical protein
LLQGVICPVLESSGGKRSIFIGWGVMCSTSHSFGGEIDFFLNSIGVGVNSIIDLGLCSKAKEARSRKHHIPSPALGAATNR